MLLDLLLISAVLPSRLITNVYKNSPNNRQKLKKLTQQALGHALLVPSCSLSQFPPWIHLAFLSQPFALHLFTPLTASVWLSLLRVSDVPSLSLTNPHSLLFVGYPLSVSGTSYAPQCETFPLCLCPSVSLSPSHLISKTFLLTFPSALYKQTGLVLLTLFYRW